MPIYTYECRECHSRLEQFIQNPKDKWGCCPECNGELDQLFSPYVIFIGKAPQSFHNKFAYPHYDGKKP